jgi:hypothetical protein
MVFRSLRRLTPRQQIFNAGITSSSSHEANLARSISSSALFSSAPVRSRAPTFTTPEPIPTTYEEFDPTQPLPPTDLPVEDYASPLAHTAGVFSNFFRYVVLTSATIVVTGVTGLVGVHLYVEKVSLAGGIKPLGHQDEFNWEEELEGWSGRHLGGGTDPRLGTVARAAVRGAWMSQNWGAGAISGPISSSSSNGGGATIGSGATPSATKEVGDAGWYLAEKYLVFALEKARTRGISLCSPGEAIKGDGSVDQAVIELEQRLAGVRELIGGRYRLEDAREGWKRIYYALASSLSPSGWESREKLRAAKKLGDLSARLSETWITGSIERKSEKLAAEGWFLAEVLPTLRKDEGGNGCDPTEEEQRRSAPTSSGFFNFFTRSDPSSSTITTVQINRLLSSLARHGALSPPVLDPATSRAVLSSLLSLETLVARERRLVDAQWIQSAALGFATSLSRPNARHSIEQSLSASPSNTTSTTTRVEPITSLDLFQLHLLARIALFSTHLAEVALALGKIETDATQVLKNAVQHCDSILKVIDPTSVKSKDYSRSQVKVINDLERDTRLTGSMSARMIGYLYSSSKNSKSKVIRGETALQYYTQAMNFSRGRTVAKKALTPLEELEGKELFDERGFRDAMIGAEKAKLL